MDKLGIMLFLLKEYNKLGVNHPMSAKEISIEVNLPLSETYLTLDVLREDGLIKRVAKRNLYRYWLKEKKIAHLNKIYHSFISGKELPSEMLIDKQRLDEIAEDRERNIEIKEQEELLEQEIKEMIDQLEFIEENDQIDMINLAVDEIIEVYSPENRDARSKAFLENKIESIWEFIIGARLVEG